MRIAETERLILREITVDDAVDFYRIYSNPENMKFMGKPPDSLEIERAHIQKHIENYYKKYGFGLWATVLKKNNRLIGRCGLLYQEIEGVKELEVAYLIDRKYCNLGLATEAADQVVKLGFEKYKSPRIIAVIHPQNTASIKVAEKIGMQYEKEVTYKDFGKVLLFAANLPV